MRPAIALDPRQFGRRTANAPIAPATSLSDDLKLFATTFVGGFLFVAIYLA